MSKTIHIVDNKGIKCNMLKIKLGKEYIIGSLGEAESLAILNFLSLIFLYV